MRRFVHALLTASLLVGCTVASDPTSGDDGPSPDAENAAIPAPGKADSPFSSCQVSAALLWANDPTVDAGALKAGGVHTRAAKNIETVKSGADGVLGTEDDVYFHNLQELDDVSWVGPVALSQLTAKGGEHCAAAPEPTNDVYFSPQATRATSHLARAEQLIDSAQHTIDIAMYSFSDSGIMNALDRARQRGVEVRFVFEPAHADSSSPAGTTSAKIEALGIDVRFVNKIMHNKFIIVDGPRNDVFDALDGTLMTGSANWSNPAGTRYDENTVLLRGTPRLLLQFQREFDLLWNNSRDFVSGPSFEEARGIPIEDWMLLDDPHANAAFTSSNFKLFENSYGPGFSVISGKNTVADVLVDLIKNAKSSIWVASAHLRSRPVAEALLARHAEDPNLDIRVYLDGQEYVAASTSAIEKAGLEDCVKNAGDSVSKQQSCYDKDYHWSYPLADAGIDLRFKHYAYRWYYTYAEQMHHKYFVIDGKILASGSYNLSDNAEHATMDNMVVYQGGPYEPMVEDFVQNFDAIWQTGEGKFEPLLSEVQNGTSDVPIVYDSMALTWEQVTTLKQAIRDACTNVDSSDFFAHPEKHFYCQRP